MGATVVYSMKLLLVLLCVALLCLGIDAGGCVPCQPSDSGSCFPCRFRRTLEMERVEVQPRKVVSPMHIPAAAQDITQQIQTSMDPAFTIPEEVEMVVFDFDETITRKDSSSCLFQMGFESFVQIPHVMSRSFATVAAAAAKQNIPLCIASANDQNMVQETRWTEDHAAFGGERLIRKFFKRFPSVSKLSDSFLYAAAYPHFYQDAEKCREARRHNFLSHDGYALSEEALEKIMPCPHEWHSKEWQLEYCRTQALEFYRRKGKRMDSISYKSILFFDDHPVHSAYGKELGIVAIPVVPIPLISNRQKLGVKAFGMTHWCAALHQLGHPCPFAHVFKPRLRVLDELYQGTAVSLQMPDIPSYPLVEGKARARYVQAQLRTYKPIVRALLDNTLHVSWVDFQAKLLDLVKKFVARTKHLWAESDVCLLLRGFETTRQLMFGGQEPSPRLTLADREAWVSLLVYGMLREELANSQTPLFIHYDLDSVHQQAKAYPEKRRQLCIVATDMLQELDYDLARFKEFKKTVQLHLIAPYVSAELAYVSNSKVWVMYESTLVESAEDLLEGFGFKAESLLEGVDSRAAPIYFDHGLPEYAIDSLFSGTVWNKRFRLPVVQNCELSGSESRSTCPPPFSKSIEYSINSKSQSKVQVFANTMDLDVLIALTESN